MKLSEAQVDAVERQTEAQPIAEENPAHNQLVEIFGEHTFYASTEGLLVLEPHVDAKEEVASVVLLAEWSDDDKQTLMPVQPKNVGDVLLADHGKEPSNDA